MYRAHLLFTFVRLRHVLILINKSNTDKNASGVSCIQLLKMLERVSLEIYKVSDFERRVVVTVQERMDQ